VNAILRRAGINVDARDGIPDLAAGSKVDGSVIVTKSDAGNYVQKTVKVALTAATDTTVGGVLKWANPETVSIIVGRVIFDVTTKSTGAATLDVGYNAAGDTSADTLMDGLDVGTAAGVFDNIENQGTNGKSTAKMASGGYIVATASATVAGLVGNAYITYICLDA
jgi:hypothetical protein